jgi:type I restriction enzyme S subunit
MFLPLPPLPEQQRIVSKIEELFTKLDAGVDALKKAKEQIKRYRQAVLKYAFEGKLTEEWREANMDKLESASVLLERIKEERKKKLGKKYRELAPIDTSELPELPKVWVWVRLGEICHTATGGTPSRKVSSFYCGNISWLKSGELNDGIIYDSEEKITEIALNSSSAKIFPRGTILIALYGATVGKLGILGINAATNQAICGIYINKKILIQKYLFYFLHSYRKNLLKKRFGGAQPNISQSIIKDIILPLPPLTEQQHIVEEIERRFSVADEIEKIIDNSLKQADRLRQSILKKAFEGKLVPQDPNDEPAEKLLERVIKEKLDSKNKKTTRS